MLRWTLGLSISALAGALVFFLIYPLFVLSPHSYSWLLGGDQAIYFLGFNFFNHESWHWPLGLIQGYSYPEMTSLVFSDSSPLVSILLKLLPGQSIYQFHGIFILFCFMLQGICGFRLLYHYSKSWTSSVLGAVFFVLLPSFLDRGYPGTRHYSLLPHFILLSAIFYSFHPKLSRNLWIWTALIGVALGFHFYLATLVGIFFIASQGKSFQEYGFRLGYVVMAPVLLLLAYAYGYFSIPVGSSVAWGFGEFSMNLNSFLNPMDRSYFIKPLLMLQHQYEGFQYLGLGLLILAGMCLRKESWRTLSPPQRLALVFITFLSLSFNVSFFNWVLLPNISKALFFVVFFILLFRNGVAHWKSVLIAAALVAMIQLMGPSLRSSGRLFWAVEYVMIFLIFMRAPKPWVIVLLLALQMVDISKEFTSFMAPAPIAQAAVPELPLAMITKDSYDEIALIGGTNSIPLALKAVSEGKKIGPLGTARSDGGSVGKTQQQWIQEVQGLKPRPKVIYIVGNEAVWGSFQKTCEAKPEDCKALTYGTEGQSHYLLLK